MKKLRERFIRWIKRRLRIKSPSNMYYDSYKYNKEFDSLLEFSLDGRWGMMPAPMSSDTALDILVSYLLGEDWYVAASISQEQCIHTAVLAILQNYSKQYRNDVAHYLKIAEEKNNDNGN